MSDASGAAFALAHHVFGTLFIVLRIVVQGVGVVITQALGDGQSARADVVACVVLGASGWIRLTVALVAATAAGPLMRPINAPPDVLPLALPLLVALAPAMLLDARNASMTAVMVAIQLFRLALIAPLMFGAGPLPALGLPGCAVAVVLARPLAIALHLWLWRQRLGLQPLWADW